MADTDSRLPVGEITPPLHEEEFKVPHILFQGAKMSLATIYDEIKEDEPF